MAFDAELSPSDIAVIGMAGRFPGAADVDALWRNLCEGVESVTFLSEEQLLAAGVTQDRIADPDYVRAAYLLDHADRFDAAFFGYSPREARCIDPQQRVLLECAWQALDDAGYNGAAVNTGVYAGCSLNTYLLYSGVAEQFAKDPVLALMSSDKDFLATRIGYKLGLQGPCVNVQSACSTSLVALHSACQALLARECDMALAGGVCVKVPLHAGYQYREGGMLSHDGHCRPFDADASGTIFASGAGVVVLKRLHDALADGDTIHAVVKGSAINNDGARKASYTAPSVEGIAEAIGQALDFADVAPNRIGYVECHGTGTALGDPIEVRALRAAFGKVEATAPWCTLASVKSNIGHLEAASGIAGFIKAVMCLKHRKLPGTLHFRTPNPALELDGSPFRVDAATRDWNGDATRHAAVLSLGVGGTNAVVILGEAPRRPVAPTAQRWHVLPLSAKTPAQLGAAETALRNYLDAMPGALAADAASTLSCGRRHWNLRTTLLYDALKGKIVNVAAAETSDTPAAVGVTKGATRPVVFALGEGMPRGVSDEPLWQEYVGVLRAELSSAGIRDTVLESARARQFTAQVALGQVWREYGVAPAAIVGQGSGALAAAYLAGAIDARAAQRILTQCAQDDCSLLAGAPAVYLAEAGQAPAVVSLQATTDAQLSAAVQALLDRHEGLLMLPFGMDIALEKAFATSGAQPSEQAGTAAVASADADDVPLLLRQMAQLWQAGVPVPLDARYRNETRNRISLPPTPMQGERHWWHEKQEANLEKRTT